MTQRSCPKCGQSISDCATFGCYPGTTANSNFVKGGASDPRRHHPCPRCGHVGIIVNECGCDPDNLPTRATQ